MFWETNLFILFCCQPQAQSAFDGSLHFINSVYICFIRGGRPLPEFSPVAFCYQFAPVGWEENCFLVDAMEQNGCHGFILNTCFIIL